MARLPIQKTYKLYIGGKFPRTESGRYLQVRDEKGTFVANVCRASRKDFRMAAVAARKAQSAWAARTAFNRGQILYRMAEMLESRSASFVDLITTTTTTTKKHAQAEVECAIDRLVWYAGWCDKFVQIFGSTNSVASSHFNFTMPEAMGVITTFTPPSAPLLGIVTACAPALTQGSTVIAITPIESAPVAIEFAEVLATSDLPGGVVNILTSSLSELHTHVTGHMDIDGVLVFGADKETEIAMGKAAADSVKRVKFEPDLGLSALLSDEAQSPYQILPWVEFKTAWHPIGV
jgi:acyl-CoA reductase-like NAD-dependent aldehyde dehydrogenase